jgi:hypothetical protein
MKVKMNSGEFLIGLGLIMIVVGATMVGFSCGIIGKY